MRATPSLERFSKVASEAVPVFVGQMPMVTGQLTFQHTDTRLVVILQPTMTTKTVALLVDDNNCRLAR